MTEVQRNRTYPILHGERVYLRRTRMQDAQNVFHWERDDVVWRYDPRRPYSQSMGEFLPIFERNYVQGNGRQFWFIIEDERHIPIGTITYFNIDYRIGLVEVGQGLRPGGHSNTSGLPFYAARHRTYLRGNRHGKQSCTPGLHQSQLCGGGANL